MATAALEVQYAVGASVVFRNRVQPAMIRHAQFRIGGDDNDGYQTLGKQILNSPETYTARFAQVIATEPSVQDEIILSPADGADVTDLQIQSAVETVYPSFVR
jgi:hypothetical protein